MATLSSINNRFVSVLYFEAFDFEALDGIANSLQQPDFLVHQTIHGAFVKLCNGNSYDEFNSPVADMEKTDFKLGVKVTTVVNFLVLDSDVSIYKLEIH